MAKQLENFSLTINFEGLIMLLAKNLYSTPDIFVRELVANSHDAIQERKMKEEKFAGRIDVVVDKKNSTIKFMDNGVGMNDYDLKNTLAVIGESSKSKDDELKLSQIGQFGIGLLSSFIVAEKVIVKTKKIGEDQAYAWHNDGSIECELFLDDMNFTGTEVTLFIRKEHSFFLDERKIVSILTKYCDFIPIPIYLNENVVNDLNNPIYCDIFESEADREVKIKAFLDRRYPNDATMDIIPFKISGIGNAKGVLYITDKRIPGIMSAGVIDVFIKRMFIKENDTELLPIWAKFVKGIIDCPDLTPNAARDNFTKDEKDEVFKFIQNKLSEIIIDRLIWLAENDAEKLALISKWHHEHLKSMAVLNEDFMKKAGDLLFIETNEGHIQMNKYITKNERRIDYDNKIPIYYFLHQASSSQFYTLAKSKNWTVINAAARYEKDYLEAYSKFKGSLVMINLETVIDDEIYQHTEKENTPEFIALKKDIENHLNDEFKTDIIVKIRKVNNVHLPAIVVDEQNVNEKISELETMEFGGAILDELIKGYRKTEVTLIINSNSHIINKLLRIERRSEEVKKIISGLYISAMLYSRSYFNEKSSNMLYTQFTKLYERFIKIYEDNNENIKRIEDNRKENSSLRKKIHELEDKVVKEAEHIQILLIFSPEMNYQILLAAVKSIFENAPYFFEIISSENFNNKKRLFDNVKHLLKDIDCVIADISDLNPDVMFQLGVIKAIKKDDFPILYLKNVDDNNMRLADIKEETQILYKSDTQSYEDIASEIKSLIEKDSKPFNKDLKLLIYERIKCFLPKSILENVSVRLTKQQVENIILNYKTMEDFISDEVEDIIIKTPIEEKFIDIIKEDLKKLINI